MLAAPSYCSSIMEKTFLKIAHGALVFVIALSLVITVAAAVYGGIKLLPAKKPAPPRITIKLSDMLAQQNAANQAGTPASEGKTVRQEASKECGDVASKLNAVSKQIGWEKKEEQVFNPNTLLFETKQSVNFGTVEGNSGSPFCRYINGFVEEQNSKLAPHFTGIDLKPVYYSNLSSFLDAAAQDAGRNQSLVVNDPNRYFAVTSFEWFNNQFTKSVDDARDNAVKIDEDKAESKVRGGAALYAAAYAFGFFFACCMVLVFMRIEVNTRELAEAVRALESKERELALR